MFKWKQNNFMGDWNILIIFPNTGQLGRFIDLHDLVSNNSVPFMVSHYYLYSSKRATFWWICFSLLVRCSGGPLKRKRHRKRKFQHTLLSATTTTNQQLMNAELPRDMLYIGKQWKPPKMLLFTCYSSYKLKYLGIWKTCSPLVAGMATYML